MFGSSMAYGGKAAAPISSPPLRASTSAPLKNAQVKVWKNILKQRATSNCPVTGTMIESYIEEGNQKI